MNKKSVYRQIQFTDVNDKDHHIKSSLGINSGLQVGSMGNSTPTDVGNKMIAEKMVDQNLKDNMREMQHELKKISSKVKDMISSCDDRLNDVMRSVEQVTKT